jgi:hypothetical protein
MTGNVRKRNNESRSTNHCCSGKEITITYSSCVFVDVRIHIRCICAVLYCCLWLVLAVPRLPTLTHERKIYFFKLLNTKCVLLFSLQLLSETIPIFMQSARYLCRILMILGFSRRIFEKYS